jgi:hypothetical protein
MDSTVMNLVMQFAQMYILPSAGLALAGVLTVWGGQWQARAKMATMHKNADLAVKAAEQMKKTTGISNDDAKKYALNLAQSWNKLSGISVSDDVALPMNEGSIPNIPSVNVVPITNTTTTTTVSSVSSPAGETIDDTPKG